MPEEKDFELDNAAAAARRLSGEADQASLLAQLQAKINELDKRLPEDPSLDSVADLRSGLDLVAVLAAQAGPRQVSEQVAGLLDYYRLSEPGKPEDNTLRSIEVSAALGMTTSLATLGAAIDQDPVEFMFNNPSEVWQDIETSDTLFAAVRLAKKLLEDISVSSRVGRKRPAGSAEFIEALRIEIMRQLGKVDIKARPQAEVTKLDRAKKIGAKIIGPGSSDPSRTPW